MRFTILLILLLEFSALAGEPAERRLNFLTQQISGKRLTQKSPEYLPLLKLLRADEEKRAIETLYEAPGFMNVSVRQWASLYLSAGRSPNLPFDDLLATTIGSVGENLDARQLLQGDYLYAPVERLGLGAPALDSDRGYEAIESRGLDLSTFLYRISPQWNLNRFDEAAGLLTTRGWARTHYNAGTNRRALTAAFEVFMCREIDSWKSPHLNPSRIRQDVTRAPQGDPRIFQTECRTCHAALDGFAGAFARVDFINNRFFMDWVVRPKYSNNAHFYPEGYVTTDTSWENLLPPSQNGAFGWRTPANLGRGIHELGVLISESESFSRCLIRSLTAHLCTVQLPTHDPWLESLRANFETEDRFRLRDLWTRILMDPKCQGISQEKIKNETVPFVPRSSTRRPCATPE